MRYKIALLKTAIQGHLATRDALLEGAIVRENEIAS